MITELVFGRAISMNDPQKLVEKIQRYDSFFFFFFDTQHVGSKVIDTRHSNMDTARLDKPPTIKIKPINRPLTVDDFPLATAPEKRAVKGKAAVAILQNYFHLSQWLIRTCVSGNRRQVQSGQETTSNEYK
jgi:hypothetical protein